MCAARRRATVLVVRMRPVVVVLVLIVIVHAAVVAVLVTVGHVVAVGDDVTDANRLEKLGCSRVFADVVRMWCRLPFLGLKTAFELR
jgi:hypothetical protein